MQRRLLLAAGLASPVVQAALCGRPLRLQAQAAEPRQDFGLQLLAVALQAGGCASSLVTPAEPDGLAALRAGRLDIALTSSLADAPAGALVVREPLRRGLPGLRLLVAPLSRAAELGGLRTLAELKRHCVIGSLSGDAALAEFKRLGLRTATAANVAGLYELLRRGEADVLSRGAAEVWDEIDGAELGRAELIALPRLALVYALDDFFVVRADAPELYTAITAGLRTLQRDGGYRRLFDAGYGLALRRSGLAQRELLTLPGWRADPAVGQAQALLLKGLKA